MFINILRLIAIALVMLPALAAAEPIKLKLAFFSSDNTHLFRSGIKPFLDAVNRTGAGRVEIEAYLNGSLGKDTTKQSQLVRDGSADLAYVIQPLERSAFPDSALIELPGIFRDGSDATLVFSSLVADGKMRGFDDFLVIGAYASEPETFHTRPPIASLAELKGKRIRANNDTEVEIFNKLGITPVFVQLYEVPDAILSGRLDGAVLPPLPLVEFGVSRFTPNHYLLGTSSVPQSLLMSRKKFESLPADVQAIIRKYSGKWAVENYIRINRSSTELAMKQLESNPSRKITVPSAGDMKAATAIFRTIVDAYASSDPRNAELVKSATALMANAQGRN